MSDDDGDDNLVAEAADQLYAVAPDEFMSLRTELSTNARSAGDTAVAKRIAALRKPTVSASAVNRLVLDDPDAVDRLADLGDRLRQAHNALDAQQLRELSTERRALVGELAKAALRLTEQRDPSAALRDEVIGTLDGAVASPEIAARLGRLTRAEQWSGFGVAPSGAPELTLVQGGKGGKGGTDTKDGTHRSASTNTKDTTRRSAATKPERAEPQAPRIEPAAKRRLVRALDKARSAFDSAESTLASAESDEEESADRVKSLNADLADLQSELDTAKRELEQARKASRSARTKRREARSALDRVERQLPQ